MEDNQDMRDEVNVDTDDNDYISTIKELKANTVDKAKYEDLRLKNKQLLDALANGQQVNIEVDKHENEPSIDDLRAFMYDDSISNLKYVESALKLRERLISEGQPDPFVPSGSKYVPTDEDYEAAKRVAEGLQEMVDIADGNPDVFMNEYQRRVKDTGPIKSNKR